MSDDGAQGKDEVKPEKAARAEWVPPRVIESAIRETSGGLNMNTDRTYMQLS
jgi:hypothetical protein